MDENTFDGSQPILVSYETIKGIEDKLNVPFENDDNKVLNGIGNFYTEYVQPNMFPIIVVSILCVYLFIKYILKQDREDKEIVDKKAIAKEKARRRKAKQIYKAITGSNVKHNDHVDHADRNPHAERSNHTDPVKKTLEDPDIANYISDDYLLTDTDNEQNNADPDRVQNPDQDQNNYTPMVSSNPMMNDMIAMQQGESQMMSSSNRENDIDAAAKLVFGK